jgi:phosphoribosyl 1,2-cyclic phosphodiesterase
MQLKVIGSNSAGNAYVMRADSGQTLLLECGLRFDAIKRTLGYDLRGVAGLLLTHCHGDHAFSAQAVLAAGITIYSSEGTHKALGTDRNAFARCVKAGVRFSVGEFQVMAFHVKHDVPEPFGYIIQHPECGRVVFITDTHYVPNTFRGLNNIIVEANYSERILDDRMWDGKTPAFLGNRVVGSHMSIETCLDFLSANDLTHVHNIVLIHLSEAHSHARDFRARVAAATGKNVVVADAGMTIPFNAHPF